MIWNAFIYLDQMGGASAQDVVAYCDLMGVDDPEVRRMLARCIVPLFQDLNAERAKNNGNTRP